MSVWKPDTGSFTKLIVLRHGEVHAEDRKGLYGQMDVRLSDHGKAQSIAAGAAFARDPISAVYASDLERARFLGEQIAGHHGLKVQMDTRFRERHFGDWQGLPWEVVSERFPEVVLEYEKDRFTVRAPGAENFLDVQTRLLPAVKEIVERHRGGTVVLACHSGPARLILADALALPLQSIFNFAQDYCCLNIIEFYDSGRTTVRLVNGTSHLPAGGVMDRSGL